MLRRSPSSFLALFGTATLVAGTVAGINAGCLTDPDLCTILLQRNTPIGTLGFLSAPPGGRTPDSTTFTINSSNAADVSTVNWIAIPKNIGLANSNTFTNNASLRRGPSGLQITRLRGTMVNGTLGASGIAFDANSIILTMAADLGGTTGKLSVPSATVNASAGSFIVNSSSATDTSTIDIVIISKMLRFSPSGHLFAQSRGALNGSTVFTRMNPMQEEGVSIIASVIDPNGTQGNLSAPLASRVNGNCAILSSAAETSVIELALF